MSSHASSLARDEATQVASISRLVRLAWRVYLALGMLAIGIYFVLPSADLQSVWYIVVNATAPLAMWLGVRLYRPAHTGPWYLLIAGMLLMSVGDVIGAWYPLVPRVEIPFPSWADAMYIGGYLVIALGLYGMIRIRAHAHDRAGLIDASIVTISLGLLSWLFLMAPYAFDPSLAPLERIVSVAYPLNDVLRLAILARLWFAQDTHPPAYIWLCLGLGIYLLTDTVYGIFSLQGMYGIGNVVDAGWPLGNVLWGCAALHPSMRSLVTRDRSDTTTLTLPRLLLLSGAALLVPATLIIEVMRGSYDDVLVMGAGTVVLFVLVLFRMNGLLKLVTTAVTQLKRSVQREQILRRAAAALVAAPDQEHVYRATLDAVIGLLGHSSAATAHVAFGDDSVTLVTRTQAGLVTTILDRDAVPQVLDQALRDRNPIQVFPGADATCHRMLDVDHPVEAIYLVPVVAQRVHAAIIITSANERSSEVKDAVVALGSQVALALERITLAADLEQRRSEARFRSLVQNASDVIMTLTPDGTMRDPSPAAEHSWGYALSALHGKTVLDVVHGDDHARMHHLLRHALERPHSNIITELRVAHADGTWRHCEVVINNLLADPDVRGIVATFRDITERKQLEEQLTQLAFHDTLSHLPNRALFMTRLEHALVRAAREELSVGVLFLDLDNFKVINDSLGHQIGDQLLVAVGERLQGCVRAMDTVARLGGDEFTILLEDIADVNRAVQVAEHIHAALQSPFSIGDHEIFINTSIGIALSAAGQRCPDDLLRDADLAMYRAKHNGKAHYAIFDRSLTDQVLERLALETDLRHALARDEFTLYYQPIVELATGRVREMEALLRWQHPERGLVSPADFIPVAEETGLIVQIGQWVLEEACRQAVRWHTQYPDDPPLIMSVNLSPRQFQDPNLVAMTAHALRASGLTPSCLKLEITENILMQESETIVTTLRDLKQLGVQLAIDDFGTGYCSLNYLKRFPVDTLKIDRSFIAGLGHNPEDTAIVQAVIAFAKALHLNVTGEGIETAEHVAQLAALNCEHGQGYYFGRPLAGMAAMTVYTGGDQLKLLPQAHV